MKNNLMNHPAVENVTDRLRSIASDAESLLRDTAEGATDAVREARRRLAAAVERAKSTCEDLQSQSMEYTRQMARSTDKTIRAHPYESLGIAFSAGVLVGLLLRRR